MIELVHLTKTYPSHLTVLDDISLHVPAGQIVGVIGSSGAGKSTLIRCVNMLERPTAGKVIVAGQELTHLSEAQLRQARRHIGIIFQHFNLLSACTVYKNVALPLEIAKFSSQKIRAIVHPLLELVGLSDKQSFYPAQLSGGQKQRVAIARALTTKPKVLLGDEPTSALDPLNTHSTLHLLRDINKRLGVTILLITHQMDVVKEICHRLAILEHGKLIEESDVLEFFSHPQSKIAKQFIRSNLQGTLPDIIQQRLLKEAAPNSDTLLRLSFVGTAAQEPLIASLSKNFNIEINILQANIELIRETTVGVMLVQAAHTGGELAQAIAYLRSKHVFVEIVGFYAK